MAPDLTTPASHGSWPAHVAIIMDGNGRWAGNRGLPRLEGHAAGTSRIRPILRCFAQEGVKYVTLYAFSTENWVRPAEEVQGLMHLLAATIERDAESLNTEGIRILHLGRLDRLEPQLAQSINKTIEMTRHNQGLTLGVAFDYGGRDEIIEAVRRIIQDGRRPSEITEQLFASYLYTSGLPDPDLVIRTGGEMRMSNFLLWQGAYAEFYSTPTLWPDFGPDEVQAALRAYAGRRRRFGGLGSQD